MTLKLSVYAIGLLMIVCLTLGSCDAFSTGKLINGAKAPELELPDREGNMVTLSSLRGKIVLVDFWASWCRPCRKVNPKIVSIYRKYKDATFEQAESFEIYSVSLDGDRDKWLKAIVDDDLIWPYHVSELKGWESGAVEKFKISAIPASFLLDQNGVIIGKDLRHQDLDRILAKRLVNEF